ncbi:MAG TPA: hypothetical protein VGF39_17875 [Stellaceae bacterium]|jgi:hypothetical protein
MPRAAREIRPNVRNHLARHDKALSDLGSDLGKGLTEFRIESAELRRLIGEIAERGAVDFASRAERRMSLPELVELPPGWGVRLGVFLDRTGMPERTFYRLREKGKLRSVLLGDRAVYVLIDTYIALLREADQNQNIPGAPQHLASNPPPRPQAADVHRDRPPDSDRHQDHRHTDRGPGSEAPATGPPP